MSARRGHERGEAREEVERLEQNLSGTVAIRALQLHFAALGEREPLLRHRRAAHVAAQPLELAALLRFDPRARVQRKPGGSGYTFFYSPSGPAGTLCSVNTFCPLLGPSATRYVIEWAS